MTEPDKDQDSPNNSAENPLDKPEEQSVETEVHEPQVETPPKDESLTSSKKSKPDEEDPYDYHEDEDKDKDEETTERQLGGRMTFLEHLDEFRRRIMYSLISIIVTFVGAWVLREHIYGFLAVPIEAVVDKLVVIKPTEPFTIYLKVSFTAALFMAAPFLLSQVWMFIAPGLYRKEKTYALPFLFSSTLLFILGGSFAYYVVLPPALRFLLIEFGSKFEPMISAVEFFDFAILIIVGMGVVFQMPVLTAFLSIFGLITPRFLWKNFRFAFLIITIIAAVVSPTTDPFNLFLWSGPMVILYTFSIGISWIFQKKRQKEEKEG